MGGIRAVNTDLVKEENANTICEATLEEAWTGAGSRSIPLKVPFNSRATTGDVKTLLET